MFQFRNFPFSLTDVSVVVVVVVVVVVDVVLNASTQSEQKIHFGLRVYCNKPAWTDLREKIRAKNLAILVKL